MKLLNSFFPASNFLALNFVPTFNEAAIIVDHVSFIISRLSELLLV